MHSLTFVVQVELIRVSGIFGSVGVSFAFDLEFKHQCVL